MVFQEMKEKQQEKQAVEKYRDLSKDLERLWKS